MRFFEKLFMNDYQRALHDPSQYRVGVDAAQVKSEIAADRRLCAELREGMASILDSYGPGEKISIAGAAARVRSTREAFRCVGDRVYEDVGRNAIAYEECLAQYLIRRANEQLADIKPGAQAAFGQAFDAS